MFSDEYAGKIRRLAASWINRDVAVTSRGEHQTLLIHLMASGLLCLTVLPLCLSLLVSPLELLPIVMIAAAIPLFLIGFLAATGRAFLIALLAMAGGTIGLTALSAVTGGMQSPFLVWTILLPIEATLLGRTRRATLSGLAAMLAAILTVAVLSPMVSGAISSEISILISLTGLALCGLIILAHRNPPGVRTAPDSPSAANPERCPGLYHVLPGLVTLHDAKGELRGIHGANAAEMQARVGDLSRGGFVDHIHVSDRLQFLQAVDRLRSGDDHCSTSVRLRCRAGGVDGKEQFRIWTIGLVAMRGEEGGFLGFLAQSQDVTAERELQRSYAQKVRQADAANEAKTRFLAAVSHELRTPLNAILGFSDVLASGHCGGKLDDSQAEYVGLIHQSGQHLLDVINSMLDLSKLEAGRYELNLEAFDLRDVLSDCEAMLAQQARSKGIVLTTRVARGHNRLIACRRGVQQILINLIANAIKFTEEGGIVTVDGSDSNGFTRISVSDTGIGMNDDELQKVGSPFVQVQGHKARQYEGTGLGLSLVKGLVGLHKGHFSIESSPGVGTTVTVELPMEGPQATASAPVETVVAGMEFPPRLVTDSSSKRENGHVQAKTA